MTRRVWTNVDKCKTNQKTFFGINGAFPRWMFFNLHRFTVVTRFFNLEFVFIEKENTLGTRLLGNFFFFV